MTLQDLITAVIGILIVFCLLLILSSTQDDSGNPLDEKNNENLTNMVDQIKGLSNAINNIKNPDITGAAAADEMSRLTNTIKGMGMTQQPSEADDLEDQNNELQEEIADLLDRFKKNKIILDSQKNSPDAKDSSLFLQGQEKMEKTLIMDIGKKLSWFWLAKQKEGDEFPASDKQERQRLLDKLNKNHRVVLFVRPSGIEPFREIHSFLKRKKISLGTDTLHENQKLNLEGK